jgi:hypothetical protein
MTRRLPFTFLLSVILLAPWPAPLHAQGDKLIKVVVEFRQSGNLSRDAVQGSGGVVIDKRGRPRPSGQLGADSRETRVQQSTGIFTLVRDGGEAALSVATQVPYPQVTFYKDYATGAGYVATGVAFKDVGTSLKVGATVLPGYRIRVRLTPTVSYYSADGSGTIEFSEASTELVVENGRPVVLGGTTTELHEVTRQILSFRQQHAGQDTTIVLTATVR